jgi:hypothetical protein
VQASALPGVHAFLAALEEASANDSEGGTSEEDAEAVAAADGVFPCAPLLPRGGAAALECAPTFVILGAQKAATTSLFALLGQHPSVALPEDKELNFLGYKGRDGYILDSPCVRCL